MSYTRASSDPTPYIVQGDLARLGALVGAMRAVAFVFDPLKLRSSEANGWTVRRSDALIEVAQVGGEITMDVMSQLRQLAGEGADEYASHNVKTPLIGRLASSIAPGVFCLVLILPKLSPILRLPEPSVVIAAIVLAADRAEAQRKLDIIADSVQK